MTTLAEAGTDGGTPLRIDRLGVVIGVLMAVALALPFATFRATRIASGSGLHLFDALPTPMAAVVTVVLAAAIVTAVASQHPTLRLALGALALGALAIGVGVAGAHLTPADNPYARVAPGSGFWVGLFAGAILLTDAMVRLKLGPAGRLMALAAAIALIAALLASGAWSQLSLLAEYRNRADVFWREATTHLLLAAGSLAAAIAIGLPLGILAYELRAVRAPLINVLNVIQTIPSIALFGMLIAPLGWIALHVPGAHALGIRGIGAAPAFLALFLYSLLPMVANTMVGLNGVSRAVVDAARGMGLTGRQRLLQVEMPLALPVILTGIRIVLVQNIGLATVAALIGGGGFGVFLFQGLGQTAADLILLGALPPVALAFAAAIVLDAAIEMTARGKA
ncbi:ABC transporter permease [Pleomorphomonas diazotrophica]|uniref:ABC transporter permease n=1 Tax=Pleomorphomonas diazotrophica TaxID=1166257 RepID=A0A1I4VT90_9HYPH|nr:ABC transporter permease [Pleomorphomonas diazotrophica]PKR89321.1 ABC transporter permease [Pleomorphomonas diazotrophica]SFN04216.1 osmoprotectant transport system permease protein [Pleomorphomonas diazotrophica]